MFARRLIASLFVIAVVIGFDQGTKWIAWENFGGSPVGVLPFLNFILVLNKGVSFGLLADILSNEALIVITVGIVLALSVWMMKTDKPSISLAVSLIIGGAIGNIIDRIRLEGVIDFLDFHVGSWHYPAFNIADTCIVIGIGFLLYDLLYLEPKNRKLEDEKERF